MSNSRRGWSGRPREAGSAVLLMMTVLVLLLSTLLLEGWTTRQARFVIWQEDAKQLGMAREGLLAFRAVQGGSRGQTGEGLPSPDRPFSGDGGGEVACAEGEVVVGWLPWRTLGLMPLRTGSGEAIWYAISRSFGPSGSAEERMASDWAGLETDHPPWAAVVFIPEEVPRPGQPVALSALLHHASLLPITVAELSDLSGGRHHDPSPF